MDHANPFFDVICTVVPCAYYHMFICMFYSYDTVCLKLQEHPSSNSKTIRIFHTIHIHMPLRISYFYNTLWESWGSAGLISTTLVLVSKLYRLALNWFFFEFSISNQQSHTTWYCMPWNCRKHFGKLGKVMNLTECTSLLNKTQSIYFNYKAMPQ